MAFFPFRKHTHNIVQKDEAKRGLEKAGNSAANVAAAAKAL